MSANVSISTVYDDQSLAFKSIAQLGPKQARSLRRKSQVLRVVSGSAWITMDGEDTYLDSNEEISLAPGRSHAVVSAMGRHSLVYEIR